MLAQHILLSEPDSIGAASSLDDLVRHAVDFNPSLKRLEHQVMAAWAKVPQVTSLPDPQLGFNVFGDPIETAAGSQRGNLSLNQRVPWLEKLDAQGQKLTFEAQALEQIAAATKLELRTQVKALYYRLYVLGKQIEITRENRSNMEDLKKAALARESQGGPAGDSIRAALESSRLDQALVNLEQARISIRARVNQLLDRATDAELPRPDSLESSPVNWSREQLSEIASEHQPELVAARLRLEASHCGITVAQLSRIPEVSFGLTWFFIDDNRPNSTVVSVGDDAWSVGATVSLPLWHDKYDAMESEAIATNLASASELADIQRRYDALIADLLEQAKAAKATLDLYETELISWARETYETDRQSYELQGKVEFDRLMTDFRNLLDLQIARHRERGRLATALAELEKATGLPLADIPDQPGPHMGGSEHEDSKPN